VSSPIVTALYVPGDRPDRFDKAVATGAQLVILDLEDAVGPAQKEAARDCVVEWLRARQDAQAPAIEVRVNADDTDDLAALAAVSGSFGLRVPKVESPAAIDAVVTAFGRAVEVTALIETALGIESAGSVAAHPAVMALNLGEADLASDLGSTDPAVLDWCRIRLLVATRAASKPAPMMSVYTDIGDLDGLRADTLRGKSMGFIGRTAIHPSQVPVIADAFRPSDDELLWAEAVLAATEHGGVTTLTSGEMVDPAMRGRAESIIALAAATQ
jgi:citrate lyase subunit beta/citryl-CoA lyase